MDLQNTRWRRVKTGMLVAFGLLAIYGLGAYVVAPQFWEEHYEGGHLMPTSLPKISYNVDGIPGDPLNVALIGSSEEVILAMAAIGWQLAAPITVASSAQIAASVLLELPYPDAPISDLYVFDHKQDLAFQLQTGESASRRRHVRWWQTKDLDAQGRPFWIGAVTLDVSTGLSYRTGQITHHIDADVDAQRDLLMADLAKVGQLQGQYPMAGVGSTQDGRNAGGDRYFTDGMLTVGVLVNMIK